MKIDIKKHVLIVAGGTGGHVYPAIAFAEKWKQEGHQASWVGTRDGLEASIVPNYDIPLYFISVQGLRRVGFLRKLAGLGQMWKAFFQAVFVLKKLKPNVVLGMGGYVSGPCVLAAKCLRIPVIIHEQNAIAGKTNAIAALFANKILSAFPDVFKRKSVTVCGNPVRHDLLTLSPKKMSHTVMKILILGGSRGALSLNQQLPKILTQIDNLEIWHQTGEKHFNVTKEMYTVVAQNVKISPYITNMREAYEWADIVICRAGAMTVFEIMAVGRPAIFIPYPYAVDDHQTVNAKFLVNRSAALIIQERDLALESLKNYIDALREMINYQRYANNAFHNRVVDADQIIVQACLELAK